jgi:hypothetical protein
MERDGRKQTDIIRIQGIHGRLMRTTHEEDQVKEDEMGRACSTNGGEEECI